MAKAVKKHHVIIGASAAGLAALEAWRRDAPCDDGLPNLHVQPLDYPIRAYAEELPDARHGEWSMAHSTPLLGRNVFRGGDQRQRSWG